MGSQLTDSFTDGPKHLIVGMSLKTTLVGKREHLVVHTRRITYSQHIDATINEFLRYPVNGHIALCTHQHLVFTSQCLIDSLHEGCGLSRSRRTMYHSHILCPQYPIDGLFLCMVQIWEMHRSKRECLSFLTRVEEVTQITQASLRLHHTVKCLKHRLITCLVEEQLDTHLFSALHINQLPVVWHSHHHPVAIHVAHTGGKVEIFDLVLFIDTEKSHRSAKLKIMFYLIVVALTENFNHELVQRVIIAFAHFQRKPGITTFHLSLQAHRLGLLAKSLLLSLILQLEQQPLLL